MCVNRGAVALLRSVGRWFRIKVMKLIFFFGQFRWLVCFSRKESADSGVVAVIPTEEPNAEDAVGNTDNTSHCSSSTCSLESRDYEGNTYTQLDQTPNRDVELGEADTLSQEEEICPNPKNWIIGSISTISVILILLYVLPIGFWADNLEVLESFLMTV